MASRNQAAVAEIARINNRRSTHRGRRQRFVSPRIAPGSEIALSPATIAKADSIKALIEAVCSVTSIRVIVDYLDAFAEIIGKYQGERNFRLDNLRTPNSSRKLENSINVATGDLKAVMAAWRSYPEDHLIEVTDRIREMLHDALRAVIFLGRQESITNSGTRLSVEDAISGFTRSFEGDRVVQLDA